MAHISGAVLLVLVASTAAIPVRYDQRQDGDWNVDAKLQNFFVVLAPTATNPANGASSGINLLEFASKAVPLRLPIRPGSGLQAAAAAVAAATGASAASTSGNEPAQDRQGNPVIEAAAPAARAALGYFAVPDAAVGAVPMLVAVPVPEVAPLPGAVYIPGPAVPVQTALTPNHIEAHGEPTALLPMLTVLKPGSNDKLPVQSVPAEALPTTLQQQAAEKQISQSAPETPALPAQLAAIEASAEASPVQAAPAPAQPAATIPEEPKPAALEPIQALPQPGALRLIGSGVEDCGPDRVRNANGVCEKARS